MKLIFIYLLIFLSLSQIAKSFQIRTFIGYNSRFSLKSKFCSNSRTSWSSHFSKLQVATYTEDAEPAKLHVDAFVPVTESTNLVVKTSLWCKKNWFQLSIVLTAVYLYVLKATRKSTDPRRFIYFQALYIPPLIWTLAKAFTTGSFSNILSVNHRNTGALSILLPLIFIVYTSLTSQLVNPVVYIGFVNIAMVCALNSYRMLKTRVPAYDTSAVPVFFLAIVNQVITITNSIIYVFGHLDSVRWIGGPCLLLNLYAFFYNCVFVARSVKMRLSIPSGTKIEGDFKGWKVPYKGMKDRYMLWDVLWTPCNDAEKNLKSAISPSWGAAVALFIPAVFQLLNILSICVPYIRLGPQIIQSQSLATICVVQNIFLASYAVLQVLTFVGSMVIHKRVPKYVGSLFNNVWAQLLLVSSIYAGIRTLIPQGNLLEAFSTSFTLGR